jgi:hypothetical protein
MSLCVLRLSFSAVAVFVSIDPFNWYRIGLRSLAIFSKTATNSGINLYERRCISEAHPYSPNYVEDVFSAQNVLSRTNRKEQDKWPRYFLTNAC